MRQVLESDVERKLVQGIQVLGGRAYKWVSPGNTGVPDRIVIFPDGKVEFVELKTVTGKVTKLQEAQINRLARLNCTVHVIRGLRGVNEYLDVHAQRLASRQPYEGAGAL